MEGHGSNSVVRDDNKLRIPGGLLRQLQVGDGCRNVKQVNLLDDHALHLSVDDRCFSVALGNLKLILSQA